MARARFAAEAEAVRVHRIENHGVGRERGHVVALLEQMRGDDSADATDSDDENARRRDFC